MTRGRGTVLQGPAVWLLPVIGVTAALGLVLAGVVMAGRYAREQLRGQERYAIAFADLDCEPPPGLTREAFFGEVQYLGNQPARLHLLDDGLPKRLAEAFGRHPWVERVRQVEITPERRIRVQLLYRMPVLAVLVEQQTRVLDGSAVLLPPHTPGNGLPAFRGKVAPPAGLAGTVWGDASIRAAAATAAYLRDRQEKMLFTTVEITEGSGIVLTTAGGSRVTWGQPPGAETAGEARALLKRERLSDYCGKHGGLDLPGGPYEYDLRPEGQMTQRTR